MLFHVENTCYDVMRGTRVMTSCGEHVLFHVGTTCYMRDKIILALIKINKNHVTNPCRSRRDNTGGVVCSTVTRVQCGSGHSAH